MSNHTINKDPRKAGKQLLGFAQRLYNRPNITSSQLLYAMTMLNPVAYAERNHTVKGHPVTFDVPNYNYAKSGGHRPWQKKILRTMCNPHVHEVCVMKSRQLGISEVGVETLLYLMDRLSNGSPKFLYIFPTQTQMDGFLKSRIQSELENPYYKSLVAKNDNSMEQLAIRNSDAFFRTGGSSKGLEGVDIDCVLMDEYEHYSGLSAEASALQSLKSSNYVNGGQHGLIRRWSTPSEPEVGIDEKFRESDRHYWLIKCPYCGHWQLMTFKDNLVVVDPKLIDKVSRKANPGACKYLCKYCHNSLEGARWYNGHWFCEFPHKNKPKGFFISQLNAVWLSADAIYTDYLRQDTDDFYRYTLGVPYQNASLTFVPKDVYDHVRVKHPVRYRGDSDTHYIHMTAGIDWGEHFHHIVIMGMTDSGLWDVVALYQIPKSTGTEHINEDLGAVISILKKYDLDIVCVDNGYSGNYVLRMQQLYPNNVYKVLTRSAISNGDPGTPFNDNNMSVTIDKVTQAKIAITDIKGGKIGFYPPSSSKMLPIFIQHWQNVMIRKERMGNGQEVEVMPTNKREHPDHFASACVYAIIAMREVTKRLATTGSRLRVSSLHVANDNREVNTGKYQDPSYDYRIIHSRNNQSNKKHHRSYFSPM